MNFVNRQWKNLEFHQSAAERLQIMPISCREKIANFVNWLIEKIANFINQS